MKKLYSYFFSDLTSGKQSPTENSYRSSHFTFQSVLRRNIDGLPVKAPRGETGGKRGDQEDNLPQDRSRDRSPQDRGTERRASFPPDLPHKDGQPQLKRSVSVFNHLQPAGCRQGKLQLGNGQFCCHVYF